MINTHFIKHDQRSKIMGMNNEAYDTIFKLGSLRHQSQTLCDTPKKCFLNLRKVFKIRLKLIKNKNVVNIPTERPFVSDIIRKEYRRKFALKLKKGYKFPEYYRPNEDHEPEML